MAPETSGRGPLGRGARDGGFALDAGWAGPTLEQVIEVPSTRPLAYPTVKALLVFSLTAYACLYFGWRFLRHRRITSLALVFMVSGWATLTGVLLGYITRQHYGWVSWTAVCVAAFMVVAIVRVEGRSALRERRRKEAREAAEDAKARGP